MEYKNYATDLDQGTIEQMESAMSQDFVVQGALMPDAHRGYSLPIGAVVATDGVVVPAWVGYDIGCGMLAIPTSFKKEDVTAHAGTIFKQIYEQIPVGFSHNKLESEWLEEPDLPRSDKTAEIFAVNGLRQLGSLGGGNHFLEIGYDLSDFVWIIIHSGSRGIGHAIATHYMKLASGGLKAREGHFGFKASSPEGLDYIKDMEFCLQFALKNRITMAQRIVRLVSSIIPGDAQWNALINRNHNHAEEASGVWIHRKGATQAEAGMPGVIPGNMLDGSFIVRGLGNPDSLYSSSHGAGRAMGRKVAKLAINMEEFTSSMKGITARVEESTLDEAPPAYKSIYEVMYLQRDLVEVVQHVRPIINVKG